LNRIEPKDTRKYLKEKAPIPKTVINIGDYFDTLRTVLASIKLTNTRFAELHTSLNGGIDYELANQVQDKENRNQNLTRKLKTSVRINRVIITQHMTKARIITSIIQPKIREETIKTTTVRTQTRRQCI
jgi:hypothetical protein